MFGYSGGCCCRPVVRTVPVPVPNYGVAIIAIAILILIALGVIF